MLDVSREGVRIRACSLDGRPRRDHPHVEAGHVRDRRVLPKLGVDRVGVALELLDRHRGEVDHASISSWSPVTRTGYVRTGRSAGPRTTSPVASSNSEPWQL